MILLAVVLITVVLYFAYCRKNKKKSHVLFVCTKCNKEKEKYSKQEIKDIEDAGLNSGCILYKNIVKSIANDKATWKAREKEESEGKEFSLESDENSCLQVKPVKCLSTCDQANCIAIAGEGKYSYQFADMSLDSVSDIMEFTKSFVESEDGFSKSKTRPHHVKKTILARIPPS